MSKITSNYRMILTILFLLPLRMNVNLLSNFNEINYERLDLNKIAGQTWNEV